MENCRNAHQELLVPSDMSNEASPDGRCLPAWSIMIDEQPATKRRIAVHDRQQSEDARITIGRGPAGNDIAIDNNGIRRPGGEKKNPE